MGKFWAKKTMTFLRFLSWARRHVVDLTCWILENHKIFKYIYQLFSDLNSFFHRETRLTIQSVQLQNNKFKPSLSWLSYSHHYFPTIVVNHWEKKEWTLLGISSSCENHALLVRFCFAVWVLSGVFSVFIYVCRCNDERPPVNVKIERGQL